MKPRNYRPFSTPASIAAVALLTLPNLTAEPAVEDSFPTGTSYYATGAIAGQSPFAAGFTSPWLDSTSGPGTAPEVIAVGLGYNNAGKVVAATKGAVSLPGTADGFAGSLGAADTNVNFFVGKFTFGTADNADSVEIWRNPEDLSAEGSSTIDFSKSGFDNEFDRISIANFSDDGIIVDEVRFGTSWADVTADDTSDQDGMRNSWESLAENALNTASDDSGADKDSDTLLNIDE